LKGFFISLRDDVDCFQILCLRGFRSPAVPLTRLGGRKGSLPTSLTLPPGPPQGYFPLKTRAVYVRTCPPWRTQASTVNKCGFLYQWSIPHPPCEVQLPFHPFLLFFSSRSCVFPYARRTPGVFFPPNSFWTITFQLLRMFHDSFPDSHLSPLLNFR